MAVRLCTFQLLPLHSVQMKAVKETIAVAEHPDASENFGQQSVSSVPRESAVVFEEFLYYAALQRRAEDGAASSNAESLPERPIWFHRLSDHKGADVNVDVRHVEGGVTGSPIGEDDAERMNALRALRVTSWISVFYLITTDILGPFNAPFAISQVGWVPGECYTITVGCLVDVVYRYPIVFLQFV